MVAGLVLVGCSSSGDGVEVAETSLVVDDATTSTTAEITTTVPAETTTTTLSAEEIALAEIEAVIKAWYEGPFDTSLGEAGLGLDNLADPLRQRRLDTQATREAAGQIQRRSEVSPPHIVVVAVSF